MQGSYMSVSAETAGGGWVKGMRRGLLSLPVCHRAIISLL